MSISNNISTKETMNTKKESNNHDCAKHYSCTSRTSELINQKNAPKLNYLDRTPDDIIARDKKL